MIPSDNQKLHNLMVERKKGKMKKKEMLLYLKAFPIFIVFRYLLLFCSQVLNQLQILYYGNSDLTSRPAKHQWKYQQQQQKQQPQKQQQQQQLKQFKKHRKLIFPAIV